MTAGLDPGQLDGYASRAARALVLLQSARLLEFVSIWRRARADRVELPRTDDPDYASLDALLGHVLGASRFYATWIAERLELPSPEIRPVPELPIEDETLDDDVDHLLERWRSALAAATPEALEAESWQAPWGAPFTADGMLEHAVMHPVRHAFQLAELMA